jgi:hypothetical protein
MHLDAAEESEGQVSPSPLFASRGWVSEDWYNGFGGGTGVTMVELMDKLPECEANLRAHCDSVGWQARDPNYDTKCMEWLSQKYPGSWSSHNIWKSCRALMNVLQKKSWKAEVLDWFGESVDFEELTTPGSPILNLNVLMSALNGIRDPVLQDWDMRAIFLEGANFMALAFVRTSVGC